MLLVTSTNSQSSKFIEIKSKLDKLSAQDTFPPLILPYNLYDDGTVSSTVIDMPEDDNIRSNLGGIYIKDATNYIFEYDSIVPGVTRKADFKFTVRDKLLNGNVLVDFTDWEGNTSSLSIVYRAPRFRMTPLSQAFVDAVTGQSLKTEFLIINESHDTPFLLRELNLQKEDQGFKINLRKEAGYLGGLPKRFAPRDSLLIEVEFMATQEGTFVDSIGWGVGHVFTYVSQISANVLSPVISAEDYDFFDVTVGDTISRKLSVRNKSDKVDLILTGYSAVRHPFRTTLPQITPDEPMVLKPGFRLNFDVFFTPDELKEYKDSIIFTSNSTGPDPISRIGGKGVEPGLIVTSYDWGRKRIDRPDRPELQPVAAYTNLERAVWMENTTEDTIQIYEVEVVNIDKGYAFEFTKDEMPEYLAPREPKYVQVAFHPTEVGYHEALFIYKTSIGDESISKFQGIGIAPKISSYDVDFDTTLVDDHFSPTSRKVVFKNENWEFEDLIEIKELIVMPNGDEISDGYSNPSATWGTEGFKIIDQNRRSIPTVIGPGDSLVFEINFSAKREGPALAEMHLFTDALKDTSAILTGFGIFYGLKPFTEEAVTCVGDKDTITCLFEHYGYDDIPVDSLILSGNLHFKLVNPELQGGFTVLTGQTKSVQLIYEPDSIEIAEAELTAYYKTIDKGQETTIPLNGISYHSNRSYTSYIMDDDSIYNIDENVNLTVMLDIGEDIAFYKMDKFAVNIKYNPNILDLESNEDIKRGDLLHGRFFKPQNIEIDKELGKIYFELIGISGLFLMGDGEFFTLKFRTKKPSINDSIFFSSIDVSIVPIGNHCVEFAASNTAEIALNKKITDNLSWINFSPDADNLFYIHPNPAGLEGANIKFEIIKAGHYQLRLTNTLGQNGTIIFSHHLEPGNYNSFIPLQSLSSGLYFVTLKGPDFLQSKKMIFSR